MFSMNTTTGDWTDALLASTVGSDGDYKCASETPFAGDYLRALPCWATGLLVLHGLVCLLNLAVFIEIVVFLVKNFHDADRLNGTIWYLAMFPVFSVTCLLSLLIPRSGTLNSLIADLYFSASLYRLMGLMENYLGGPNVLAKYFSNPKLIKINTLPVACCCVCLPSIRLNRRNYIGIYLTIIQGALVRPLAMYIAAVLWTNNSYIPGGIEKDNAYLYLAVAVVISTVFTVWGLIVIDSAFAGELDERHKMAGKILTVQIMLISMVVVGIVCAALVHTNVIRCSAMLPSPARADEIFHQCMNFISLLVLLLCRLFFRRTEDANDQRYVHFTNHHEETNRVIEA